MKCLIVLAKAPAPGKVKTRLCPPLTHGGAARLAEAFLLDSLEEFAALAVDVRLYLAGSWTYRGDLLCGASLHRQSTGSLGDRLMHAFQESTEQGYREIVVTGTDHPTLPKHWVMEALKHLELPDSAAIGPAADGGFYLLGLNPYASEAFAGEFSHPLVFAETHARLTRRWERVHVLPEWYDIDTAVDLRRLAQDLRTYAGCLRTKQVLASVRVR